MRRGILWLGAGVVLALVAGVIAVYVLQQSIARIKPKEEPKVQALVAARDIPLHSVLTSADVTVREVPPELVPDDGLSDAAQAVGQLTTVDLAAGEVILKRRLIRPDYVGPNAAFVMDPKKVLIAFPAYDLLGSLDIIRPGDRVDILFSHDFAKGNPDIVTGMNTVTVLQNVRVAAVIHNTTTQAQGDVQAAQAAAANIIPQTSQGQSTTNATSVRAILLAVDPQDALTIKYFRDAGAAPDLVLRSPVAPDEAFEVAPVDGEYLINRFHIRSRVKK